MVEEFVERRGEGSSQVDPGAGRRLGKTKLGGVEEIAVGVEGREFELADGETF